MSLKVISENKDLAAEDRIELVTILKSSARCFLNGKDLGVAEQGLQIHSIPIEPGNVRVRVVRDGKRVIDFETQQAISNAPLRTDRLTYSYSSEFDRSFQSLFDP